MQPTPSQQLVYLSAQGQGVVTCPQCTKQSQISASTYRDLHAPIRVACGCGHRFTILLNTRHFYRKAVRLSGTYTSPRNTSKRRMTVVDLSMTGVRLLTLLPHDLKVDDIVELVFRLDDAHGTEMCNEAIVRWIDGKQIGAEFSDLRTYESKLGFYLLPA